MKNLTATLSTLILILALTFGTQVRAEKDSVDKDKKETVHVKIQGPLLRYIIEIFEAKDVTICYCNTEFELVIDVEDLEFLGLYEDYESQKLEDWMFEELNTPEEDVTLEDWMLDTEYFSKSK